MDSNVPIHVRPGDMIGAWGFHFFESDHDLDVVADLSHETGVDAFKDSLLNPGNPGIVRQCLNDGGALNRVFIKYFNMLRKYRPIDIKQTKVDKWVLDSLRYYIFLLGLLAMQFSCPLSRNHQRWMTTNWSECLFMYERLDQAKIAVFEYENGEPLHLGSLTLNQKIMSLTKDNAHK